MSQAFQTEISDLVANHTACLAGAPNDDHVTHGTCSKLACQGLHTAMDDARKRSTEEGRICRGRVNDYQQAKRREEDEERRKKDAAARQAQDDARADTERRARDAQDRTREQAQRDADKNKREQDERADREKRSARERDEAAARVRDEAAARVREEGESRAKRERDEREAVTRMRRESELAELRAQQEAAKREKDAREQVLYEKLIKGLRTAEGTVKDTKDFLQNPFETTARKLSDAVSERLVDAAVDNAFAGPEKRDPRYEIAAEVVDKARETGLAGNPFAEKVSGLAMQGINGINRKMLGELDAVSASIEQVGRDDRKAASSPGSAAVGTLTVAGSTVDNRAAPNLPRDNPFSAQVTRNTYYDPESRATIEVQAGYVLYRDPATRVVRAIPPNQLPSDDVLTGDQAASGTRGCAMIGVGVITPACESWRRKQANPFAGGTTRKRQLGALNPCLRENKARPMVAVTQYGNSR